MGPPLTNGDHEVTTRENGNFIPDPKNSFITTLQHILWGWGVFDGLPSTGQGQQHVNHSLIFPTKLFLTSRVSSLAFGRAVS